MQNVNRAKSPPTVKWFEFKITSELFETWKNKRTQKSKLELKRNDLVMIPKIVNSIMFTHDNEQ